MADPDDSVDHADYLDHLDLPEGCPTLGTDDAMGRMVWDYWRGEYDGSGVYRDPMGRPRDAHPEWYFGGAFDGPVPETRRAMDLAAEAATETGAPVFDLGCGPGQDARRFQSEGTPVVAGDPSLGSVRVAREAGVDRVLTADLNAPPLTADSVGCVYASGTQLGTAGGGTVGGLRRVLGEFDRLVAPDGRVVADLKDPQEHREEAAAAPNAFDDTVAFDPAAGMGLRLMRTEYRDAVGRWIPLLLLTPEAATRAVEPTPWDLVDTVDGDGSRYYLHLERRG
ncbi:class I SAM-dependent methyltransferase [Salinirubellus salinus]|uniref:Class I SAM-dependent methyltransferase n=1 Tax=Salinirubellus salinus TaxID=1364945 RepID=A0A9E7UBX3_9EURY|nr:class I SAM-dependent methyltransferase [Salinirubellus salinus]UWM55713.1 class I SAM-dependent methyltransferase [Salinirubellus salinus]